jgi:hypothetical protein
LSLSSSLAAEKSSLTMKASLGAFATQAASSLAASLGLFGASNASVDAAEKA